VTSPNGGRPITFNRPHATGREFGYIQEAIDNRHLSGNGPFAERCAAWLEERIGCARAFLMNSGTASLEMAAILADLRPGDEVIMPSFTFVTTASAVALRGATPVFADIRPDTLNLDEDAVEGAITERTKAIVPMHYAGIGCEMDRIMQLARDHGLIVIEDAAQGIMSSYRGGALGSFGAAACLSFHETKNVICGEGGALLVNEDAWIERAEILQEKGTNRSKFFRGEVGRYTWVELGSSFLMSEVNAAFLWAQLEGAQEITANRLAVWERYHEGFADLERDGLARRPGVPEGAQHNGHMYYLILPDERGRDALIDSLAERGVQSVFHYVPLHSSPAGRRFGRTQGPLRVTNDMSARLVRLPLWTGMEPDVMDAVVDAVHASLRAPVPSR
jgi:dTDP-4-amino-4,6-dideoxygalactose transaminase